MKKLLFALFAAIVLAAAPAAKAQSPVFYNDDYSAYFGFRAGADIVKPSPKGLDTGGGGHLGLFYNIPVYYNLYLEPGATFYYDTFKRSQVTRDQRAHLFGMRIPLELGYRFDFTYDFGMNLFTGVEFDWGWSGKLKGEGQTVNLFSKDEGNIKSIDLSWNFGVSLFYYRYSLTVMGSAGLLNRYRNPINDATFYQNRLSISLGYSFLWE